MNAPKIAQTSPIPVTVKAGKTYYWCSCGESKAQPFCDGSHKGTEFAPVAYTAEKDGPVYFCACKHSAKGMLCDGTHKTLAQQIMNTLTIHQNGTKAQINHIFYRAAEGFEEENTWCVREEIIRAELDTKISSGTAEIHLGSTIFPVTVEVIKFENTPSDEVDDDDDVADDPPVCEIEIRYADGLPKLANALGLLEHYSKKQKAALDL